ncbi:MAG: hypothetical protein AAB801_03220 [Patescibacteria group bacterium]
MPYISFFVQNFSDPINIFELILRHRQALLVFSFLFNAFLILRFRLSGFMFVLFYEFSKFYIFGDRFLAESFIVYPIVYMTGILILKFHGREIHPAEYYLTALLSWFVIFMREPYTLLALALFAMIHIPTPKKIAIRSLAILAFLSLITIFQTPIGEYYFNVVTVNKETTLSLELSQTSFFEGGFLRSFFYPIYVFIEGEWNIFRVYLLSITLSFLIAFSYYSVKIRNFKLFAGLLIVLFLANLRFIVPGKVFFEAYRLIPWFGIITISTFLALSLIKRKSISYVLYLFLILTFLNFIFSNKSYLRDEIDQHFLLLTNFSREMGIGQTVKDLSKRNDTYFADGFLELSIWQSGLLSPYKYQWYQSVMPHFEKYKIARMEMFKKSLPDFYFGSCEKGFPTMPDFAQDNYVRLESFDKPSCIFVHKNKLSDITSEQWKKAFENSYSLPEFY